ncbi:ABC transporter permease, partial [Morganella morganii]
FTTCSFRRRLLLLPVSLLLEPALPPLTLLNISGLLYLGLIGAALTYLFWFRGLAILGPNSVASLGFLSPLTAVLLGWFVLDQQLSLLQCSGVIVVIGSVWLSQVANRR